MHHLASEFQAISDLYLRLTDDLGKIEGAPGTPKELAKSILQARDSLTQIERLNSRVLRLAVDWKQCRASLDPRDQDQIGRLAEAVRTQAIRLNEICGAHARKLETVRESIGRELTEVGKGRRYAKSAKSVKTNYPKFIDSLY